MHGESAVVTPAAALLVTLDLSMVGQRGEVFYLFRLRDRFPVVCHCSQSAAHGLCPLFCSGQISVPLSTFSAHNHGRHQDQYVGISCNRQKEMGRAVTPCTCGIHTHCHMCVACCSHALRVMEHCSYQGRQRPRPSEGAENHRGLHRIPQGWNEEVRHLQRRKWMIQR